MAKLLPLKPRSSDECEPYQGVAMGRWTEEEHCRFLTGIARFPRGPWRKVADIVGTRTLRQTRTHADKFFKKEKRKRMNEELMTSPIYFPKDVSTIVTLPPHDSTACTSEWILGGILHSDRIHSIPSTVTNTTHTTTSTSTNDTWKYLLECFPLHEDIESCDNLQHHPSPVSKLDFTFESTKLDSIIESTKLDSTRLNATRLDPTRLNSTLLSPDLTPGDLDLFYHELFLIPDCTI